MYSIKCPGSCHVLNGGCGDICVPEENGRKCDCDVGLKLQPDQSCASGKQSYCWCLYQVIEMNYKVIVKLKIF